MCANDACYTFKDRADDYHLSFLAKISNKNDISGLPCPGGPKWMMFPPPHLSPCPKCCYESSRKNVRKSLIRFMEASRALFLPEYPSTSIWTSCLRCSQNLLPTTSNQSSWISGLLWYHPYIALGEGYSTRYFYGSLFSRFKIPQSSIWTKY